jgi:hypothetical protein
MSHGTDVVLNGDVVPTCKRVCCRFCQNSITRGLGMGLGPNIASPTIARGGSRNREHPGQLH